MRLAPELPAIVASRYVPIRLIAQGGMGAVYEVEHARTGERLALKVLLDGVGSSDAALERFKREARASARIKSEHVVRVTDADVAPELGGAPFLVMELLDGVDLEQAVANPPPPPAVVVDWLRQVARALEKAHRLGLVHRDLKPANLFLANREGQPPIIKVLDFGIVKVMSDGAGATASGQILGTATYMAPEQASGSAPVSAASDRWALGLIAYRLLLGRSYYESNDVMRVLAQLLHEPLARPSARDPRFGAAFDVWFAKACHRSPDERFPSTREQIEALAEALGLPRAAPEPAMDLTLPSDASGPAPPTGPRDSVASAPTLPPTAAPRVTGATAPEPRPQPRRRTITMTALAAGGLVLAIGVAQFARRPPKPVAAPVVTYVEHRVISDALEPGLMYAALAPDGQRIAYADQRGLYLTGPDGQDVTRIPVHPWRLLGDFDFVPDGTALILPNAKGSALELLDLHGKATPLALIGVDATVSPSGRQVLVNHEDGLYGGDFPAGRLALVRARSDEASPARWSPDGRWFATIERASNPTLVVGSADGARALRLRSGYELIFRTLTPPAWLASDRILFPVHMREGETVFAEIHELRVDPETMAAGTERVIARWPDMTIDGLAAAPASGRIVVVRNQAQDDVFVASLDKHGRLEGEPAALTKHAASDRPTDWLEDGRVLFNSDRSGRYLLYAQRPDDTLAEPFLQGAAASSAGTMTWARAFADGSSLYWSVDDVGARTARLMRAARSGPPVVLAQTEILSNNGVGKPAPVAESFGCARRAPEICVMARYQGGFWVLQRFDGRRGGWGAVIRGTIPRPPSRVDVSPDGTKVAWSQGETLTISSIDGENEHVLHAPDGRHPQYTAWQPNGAGLYVTGNYGPKLGWLALVGLDGTFEVLIDSTKWLAQPTISWDGKRLAWLSWVGGNDIVTLTPVAPRVAE